MLKLLVRKNIGKEPVHMLGHGDLLSGPRIEMIQIWEPLIEKAKATCF